MFKFYFTTKMFVRQNLIGRFRFGCPTLVWIINRKVLILKLLRSFCCKVIETSLTYKFRRRLQTPLKPFRRDLRSSFEVKLEDREENLWQNRKWRRRMSSRSPWWNAKDGIWNCLVEIFNLHRQYNQSLI